MMLLTASRRRVEIGRFFCNTTFLSSTVLVPVYASETSIHQEEKEVRARGKRAQHVVEAEGAC